MLLPQNLIQQLKRTFSRDVRSHRRLSSGILLVMAVIPLTATLGHRFYNAPQLAIGKAAPETVTAPANATVEDTKATEESRKAARQESTSMLKLDSQISDRVSRELRRRLNDGSEIRDKAGIFPFEPTSRLSAQTQVYLRKVKDEDWKKIQGAVNLATTPAPVKKITSGKSASKSPATPADQKPPEVPADADAPRAISELRAYRKTVAAQTYSDLIQKISEARSSYSTAISTLPQNIAPDSHPLYDTSLLDLSEPEWQRVQTIVQHTAERMMAQGIPAGLSTSMLQNAIKLHIKGAVSVEAEPLASRLVEVSLQPNLVRDEEKTLQKAEQAAKEIQPILVSIRRGEVIVQAGQEISLTNFALLDHFGLSRRGIDWLGLAGFGVLVGGAIGFYWLIEHRFHPKLRQRDRLLILLIALSTPILTVLHAPATNLPAVGLLVGSFYGSPLGIAVTGLMAVLLPVGMVLNWSSLISSAVAGIVCGFLTGRLRSREELAMLGVAVGVLQGLLYLLLNLASGAALYTLLGSAALHALVGLVWIIMAIGVSPYLEHGFDLVTILRLVELANPNRPLLKRLAAETPGTFQHTLFVATLAEAAARELGCNVELVRTGTLYHDIGKMHDPQGFIENQMGGANKHDLIDDPWKSTDIIKKHVTEGLVMARKFRLPKAVQAFIPEHQGTMLIAYFYHQAQQRSQQNSNHKTPTPEVSEADFRYDGPAPQSRETGIVMLADSCEAALRSLKEATPQEALTMINKILRARWQDNQLENSGLTREEMSKIASIFVEVWQQSNHQRIAYPKLPANPKPPVASK